MRFRYRFLLILIPLLFSGPATAGDLDFSKAITIGSGPKTVVEFTDPDCPHCRRASKYFDGRSDVTRRIFFLPLARHARAKEKAQFVLSMPDKAKAYHDVMDGRLDSAPQLPSTAEGVRLQGQQYEIAVRSKIKSTPTFLINGRVIVGFDQAQVEEALGAR